MKIKLIVDGGNMKPGPTVAQQLGPMGINMGKVIEDVNKATTGFKGMKVPVEIDVDPKTKDFTVSVSSPPVSELIKKQVGAEKGSGKPHEVKVGNLAIEEVIAIAQTKMPDMLAKDLKAAVKLVLGSCVPLGVLIESKSPQEITEAVDNGTYDNEISQAKTEPTPEKRKELDAFFAELKSKQEASAKAEEAAKAAEEAAKLEKASAKEEEKKDEKKDDKDKKK